MRKRNFRSAYTKPTLVSYEQSKKPSLESSSVLSECAGYASSLSLRLVWKRCPGRGSAANAKNASTPLLATGNIALNHQRESAMGRGLFALSLARLRFHKQRTAPTQNCQSYSSCRRLHDHGKGGIFCFPQFC